MKTKRIVIYSIIASLYAVLSLFMGTLSFAGMQIRIGEILMILCIFDRKYIIPLTFACFLTNIIGVIIGINPFMLDVVFGTVASFLSGLLMNKLKNILLFDRPVFSMIIPAIVNGLIIGTELAIYLNGGNDFYTLLLTNGLFVFLGEFVSVFIFGLFLFKPFENLSKYLDSIGWYN